MPELPDVEMYKKEADKVLNTKIVHVSINDNQCIDISSHDSDGYIKGKSIKETSRVGKYLFLKLSQGMYVLMHFGMTGSLICVSSNKEKPKYTKFGLKLENNNSLYYISKRKLGTVQMLNDKENFLKNNHIGPDIGEMDKKGFQLKLRSKKSKIKTALMDQSLMSGIGNIYADEILCQSGIHPGKPVQDLTDKQLNTIFTQLKKVIDTAIQKEAHPENFPKHFLTGHRKEGKQCPNCNGKIEKIKISGRSTYLCPKCQKT